MDTTINMTPPLHDYLVKHSVREHTALTELRRITHQFSDAIMQISPEQGQFMAVLVQMLKAKKTLDIGTFTGYSALAVALALPADAKVYAFDIKEEWTNIAKQSWAQAGVADKIQLTLGPADQSLQALLDQHQANTFDFAFIDADKSNYDCYYELALKLLKSGGVVAVDNVLWSGAVADPAVHDKSTESIRALNKKIHGDQRVNSCMLPIGDGLTLAIKK